jgi:hypothetical protein
VKEVKENILSTLIYFDLFKYPLTSSEIYLFLRKKMDQGDFDNILNHLVAAQVVYQFGDYYTLQNNHMLVVRRCETNKSLSELIKQAEKISDRLIKLPYVRGIAMLGSPAKGLTDEKSVIDFFVITAQNRLWLARTLMQAAKELGGLLSKQPRFNLNHFVDEGRLQAKEKNMYTAIDLVSLAPLQGDVTIEQFYGANSWLRHYLPHQIMRISSAKPANTPMIKRLFEYLFDGIVGNLIDSALMMIMTRVWKNRAGKKRVSATGRITIMDAGKHHAKPNISNNEASRIAQYESRISEMIIAPQTLRAN